MINLVGITGLAGHGKDTVADMLLPYMPGCVRYAYADPMKAVVHTVFSAPMSPELREHKEAEQVFRFNSVDLYSYLSGTAAMATNILPYMSVEEAFEKFMDVLEDTFKFREVAMDTYEIETSWRQLYQITGTEWGRQKIDLDFWIDQAPTSTAIITDVRGQGDHPVDKNTEALHVLKFNGLMLEVYDPRKGSTCRSHSSEAGIDKVHIDEVIINDGTLEDLEAKVRDVVYKYLLKGESDE